MSDKEHDSPGHYSFTLQRSNNPVSTAINYGDTINDTIDAYADTDVYSFTAVSGDKLVVPFGRGTSGEYYFFPYLELFDGEGTLLASAHREKILSADIPADGTYYIFVSDKEHDASTGHYSFTLQRSNNPVATAIIYGDTINDTIDADGDSIPM